MKALRTVIVASLILVLAPAVMFGRDEPCRDLAKKIVKLEARIQALEARIRLLELEVSRLSNQPGAPPLRMQDARGNWGRLEKGMTKEEVRGILGEPDDIPPYSYLEIWDYSKTYGGSSSVTFDENGMVESWTAPSE